MKRIFALLFSVLILCSYALAAEVEDSDSLDYYSSGGISSGSGGSSSIDYDLLEELLADQQQPTYILGSDIPADAEITDISVMSLSPITPDDTSGLKAVLLSLIGDYDPVIIEYEYESSNGYTNYLREVQPDYVWLCSVGLFAIIVYCIFRLGGALLRD